MLESEQIELITDDNIPDVFKDFLEIINSIKTEGNLTDQKSLDRVLGKLVKTYPDKYLDVNHVISELREYKILSEGRILTYEQIEDEMTRKIIINLRKKKVWDDVREGVGYFIRIANRGVIFAAIAGTVFAFIKPEQVSTVSLLLFAAGGAIEIENIRQENQRKQENNRY